MNRSDLHGGLSMSLNKDTYAEVNYAGDILYVKFVRERNGHTYLAFIGDKKFSIGIKKFDQEIEIAGNAIKK